MSKIDADSEPAQFVQLPSDTDAESIGVRVVELVAELEDCDPEELPELQQTVDGDALDALVSEAADDRYLNVEFEYNDTIVSITSRGRISVQRLGS